MKVWLEFPKIPHFEPRHQIKKGGGAFFVKNSRLLIIYRYFFIDQNDKTRHIIFIMKFRFHTPDTAAQFLHYLWRKLADFHSTFDDNYFYIIHVTKISSIVTREHLISVAKKYKGECIKDHETQDKG